MKTDTSKLITIRSYAEQNGYTTAWVYELIKNKKVKSIEVDGVKFIVIK